MVTTGTSRLTNCFVTMVNLPEEPKVFNTFPMIIGTQPPNICSKLTTEALEQSVKYFVIANFENI